MAINTEAVGALGVQDEKYDVWLGCHGSILLESGEF